MCIVAEAKTAMVRQRNTKNVVPGRFNRSDADKNESKCSDKFRKPGTKFFHRAMRSNCKESDKGRVTSDQTKIRPRVTRHRSLVTLLIRPRNWDISRAAVARLYRPLPYCQHADKRSQPSAKPAA